MVNLSSNLFNYSVLFILPQSTETVLLFHALKPTTSLDKGLILETAKVTFIKTFQKGFVFVDLYTCVCISVCVIKVHM